MPDLNIGVPEVLVAIVIGLFLWAVRRFPIEKRAAKYVLVVLAILAAVLIFNWVTPFRSAN